MKSSFVIAGLLASLSAYSTATAPVVSSPQTANLLNADGPVMVVAHRACWRATAENSLAAVQACIAMGVDMIEIDVQRSADGALVVIHDRTVDRTTNGQGKVADKTLAELQQLRLKAFAGGAEAPLTEASIPTLKEVLLAAKGKLLINLDAKDDVRDEAYHLAAELGMADAILIKMGMTDSASWLQDPPAFWQNSHFMPIIRSRSGDLLAQLEQTKATQPVAYEVIYDDLNVLGQVCARAASYQQRCWVNTLWESLSPGRTDAIALHRPDHVWGALIGHGVSMIQTDRPQLLLDYLHANGYR